MSQTTLDRIAAIRAKADEEIEALKQTAVSELVKQIAEAKETLQKLQNEYEKLTGKTVRGEKVSPRSGGATKAGIADEKELLAILRRADGHKLNRKGFNDLGFSLKSALIIARANGKLFGHAQNGPQGEVWLK